MSNEKVTTKIPPSDVAAEQAVLGSMLVDKEAVIKAIELLKPTDFYRQDNGEIFCRFIRIKCLRANKKSS